MPWRKSLGDHRTSARGPSPRAVVILGGLATSTLLNLFILPALYLAFGQGRKRHRKGEEAAVTEHAPAPAG